MTGRVHSSIFERMSRDDQALLVLDFLARISPRCQVARAHIRHASSELSAEPLDVHRALVELARVGFLSRCDFKAKTGSIVFQVSQRKLNAGAAR